MPRLACDCHVHVVGAQEQYPMQPRRQYTPPTAVAGDLKAFHASIGIARRVLIQPSFYGTDNSCMLDAMTELGETARGVAVIDSDIGDDELRRLDGCGVRGIRLNLETGGIRDPAAATEGFSAFADRIAPLGWHIQIFAGLELVVAVADVIAGLPVPVVIDHFGGLPAERGPAQPGLSVLVDLARSADVYLKLSAPYRISSLPRFDDVEPIARALIEAAPERMLWGTDWPHTNRLPGLASTAVHPYRRIDDRSVLKSFIDWCADDATCRTIMEGTPARLYRF